jgi:Ser/Thr protein kinase RdoA (MazF antagonist)
VTLHVDEVLSGRTGALGVRGALRSSPWRRNVRGVLVDAMAGPTPLGPCRLRRTKFKPGRKLTAYFDASVAGHGGPRAVAVTWQADDGAPVERSTHEAALEAEAGRRGLGTPFRSLTAAAPELRMRVDIAPLDAAFPQLVRLSDPAYVTRLIGGTTRFDVVTVRYRPRQRHVLLYHPAALELGSTLFAKLYRDESGAHAQQVALAVAELLDGSGVCAGARPLAYLDNGDRALLFASVPGRPLSACLRGGARGVGAHLRTGGATLRRLHDAPAELGALVEPRAVEAELRATDRACEAIQHLLPCSGPTVRDILARTRDLLTRVPTEPPRFAHGDYKADHLLVGRGGVTLIDFDRCARADPSLDLAKFLADLRWWTTRRPSALASAQQEFLDGYGPTSRARLARARVLEPLLLLKMTARRVPVHEPDWDGRTSALVLQADRVLRDVERANP